MARLIAVVLCACSLIACSNESPVSPGGAAASGGLDAKPSSGGVPGVYDLTFWAWLHWTPIAHHAQDTMIDGACPGNGGKGIEHFAGVR